MANLTIGNLRLRVSGLSRESARELGEAVAQALARESLPVSGSRKAGMIQLRVCSAQGATSREIANEIAVALHRTLR